MESRYCHNCYTKIDFTDYFYRQMDGRLHLGYKCHKCKQTKYVPFESNLYIPTTKSKKELAAERQPRLL